jgi:hypothetical protein
MWQDGLIMRGIASETKVNTTGSKDNVEQSKNDVLRGEERRINMFMELKILTNF